jgi:hypothetical protein
MTDQVIPEGGNNERQSRIDTISKKTTLFLLRNHSLRAL